MKGEGGGMDKMNALRLSTAAGLKSNSAALSAHLFSLRSTGPVASLDDPLRVYLAIHDLRRDTLLRHVEELYEVALRHHLETCVFVIPHLPLGMNELTVTDAAVDMSNTCGVCYDGNSVPLFTAELMSTHNGFDPLYKYVALGGTFDRLHAGHKMLLTTAAFYTKKFLRVGVTKEALLTNKLLASYIQSFETRCNMVFRFLRSLRTDISINVVGITERSGGTNCDAEVEALVVSPETVSVVASINAERAVNKLPPLHHIQIPYVGIRKNKPVSSTELREEELNKNKDQK